MTEMLSSLPFIELESAYGTSKLFYILTVYFCVIFNRIQTTSSVLLFSFSFSAIFIIIV